MTAPSEGRERVLRFTQLQSNQLDHLADVTERGKITLQVLPFGHGAHPGMQGPFTVLNFPWPADPGLVYIEHRSGAFYLEDPQEIDAHTVAFEHLCAHALSPDESVTMIRNVAKEYR